MRDALTRRVQTSGIFNWWHWMDGVWLLKNVGPQPCTPKSIAEWLEKTPGWVPGTKCLVLDADTREYWGRIEANAWPWFESTWKTP